MLDIEAIIQEIEAELIKPILSDEYFAYMEKLFDVFLNELYSSRHSEDWDIYNAAYCELENVWTKLLLQWISIRKIGFIKN